MTLREFLECPVGPEKQRFVGTRDCDKRISIDRRIQHFAQLAWNRESLLGVEAVFEFAEEEHECDPLLSRDEYTHPAPQCNTFKQNSCFTPHNELDSLGPRSRHGR